MIYSLMFKEFTKKKNLSLFFHLKRNKKFVIIVSDKEIKEVINMGKMTLKDAARIQSVTG